MLGFPRVIDEKAARTGAAVVALTGAIVVAATLEAGLGLCLGCTVFAGLMRAGIVPETVCVECADISTRLQRA